MVKVTYDRLIAVPELLSLQQALIDHETGLLFITVHQVHELIFKLVLQQLDRARAALREHDVRGARHHVGRGTVALRALLAQLALLETMTAREFGDLRPCLGDASGLQSAQYRELRCAACPALWSAFSDALAGGPGRMQDLFANPGSWSELHELAEAMVSLDAAFDTWRFQHLRLAERFIGGHAGTATADGVRHLERGLAGHLFSELWTARSDATVGRPTA